MLRVTDEKFLHEQDQASESNIFQCQSIISFNALVVLQPRERLNEELGDGDLRLLDFLRVRIFHLLILLDQYAENVEEFATVLRTYAARLAREVTFKHLYDVKKRPLTRVFCHLLANKFDAFFKLITD